MRRSLLIAFAALLWAQGAWADGPGNEKHLLPEESAEGGDRGAASIRRDEYWRNRLGRSNNDRCIEYNDSSVEDQVEWLERGCRCLTREEAAQLTPARESWAQVCLASELELCEGDETIWSFKARCYREAIRQNP